MITRIKIDTEAIQRNGARPKSEKFQDYEPAIMVIEEDNGGNTTERVCHTVEIPGPCVIIQHDGRPGALSKDGRVARVWIEYLGKVYPK